ncbi:single-stranded DNA-binding protein [Roseivirga sp. 4D4]|uniref:single-stranded DNA-binding protein n=1 Tax=Roseivirga sp. 4D4 TaxID=1889784 RepID=UPI00147C99D3|nr:single-stranded DNA-binding protein [Roseivirga sp. 4D4]
MSNTTENTTVTTKTQEDLFADTNITQRSGRLTKDAELIKDGKFVKFRIASNKEYIDTQSGELKTTTNYFNALVSNNLTDAFNVAQELKKGDWVYFKGEDATRSIDTVEGYKETGVTTFAYKVVLKKPKLETTANSNQLEIDQSVNGASLDQQ